MRVLHTGPHRRRERAPASQPRADRCGDPRGALGEHLPLHRLREDPRGGPRRRAGEARMTLTRTRIRGTVGESVERPDGAPKVKGEFRYASDLWREGMLHGATLRSPHAHARIASIDTAKARALPGVRAVLTHDDLPTSELFGLMKSDQYPLARAKVRY